MPIVNKSQVDSAYQEQLRTLRHSTAHLLAQAVQTLFPETHLAFGPAIDDGFYYDFNTTHTFSTDDLTKIEKKMKQLAELKTPFVKRSVTKQEAIELLKKQNEQLKIEHVDSLPDDQITFFQSGDFIDLCAGPHVEHTGLLKHFKLTSVSGCYWKGDENNQKLQRIYGTAFESEKSLKDHLNMIEEAKKRDHRILGKQLNLFAFSEKAGAGLPFYLTNGAFLYQEIKNWMWDLHISGKYGHEDKTYTPIFSPHILKTDAWYQSGHIQNYRENMFLVYSLDELDQGLLDNQNPTNATNSATVDKKEWGNYGIKPMNCPGHVLMYDTGIKSYRDLPIRSFEFGNVYRYERAGTLHGLLRVRSFTQDDAHLFCTKDQYESEIEAAFDFCCFVLDTFNFDYYVSLKTRGETRIGSDENWDMAEAGLKRVLEKKVSGKYHIEEGDAAFYGPKIDFMIKDCLGREWQGGTLQLDFNLPERFDLTFINKNNEPERPVMIHRAIMGSFERFIGLLIEEFGGAFPLWIAPVHVRVLPISENFISYAKDVTKTLKAAGFRVECDEKDDKLGKKIRQGKLDKIPYLLVIGQQEQDDKTVAVESYFDGKIGSLNLETLISKLNEEKNNKVIKRKIEQ